MEPRSGQTLLVRFVPAFAALTVLLTSAPAMGGAAPRAIYGNDDRRDLYEVEDPALRRAARAVALLVDNWNLNCDASATVCDLTSSGALFGGEACTSEPFMSQPTAGFCTGFLVAPDLVVTAGHCIDELSCAFTAFVFGFEVATPDGVASTNDLPTYRCAEVVQSVLRDDFGADGVLEDGADHALVRLDRPVDERAPLALRRDPTAALGEELVVMGHPYGLPAKVAGGAEVTSMAPTFFVANLDIAGGNSGSPVLARTTFEVLGILVRGQPDEVADLEQGCIRSARYTDQDGFFGSFSQATHAALLPPLESCAEAGCAPPRGAATCLPHFFLPVHHARPCLECRSDRAARKAVRAAEKAIRLLQRGDFLIEFNLRRAEKALKQALRLLDQSTRRLGAAGSRVSDPCRHALQSVIAEAVDFASLDLAWIEVFR